MQVSGPPLNEPSAPHVNVALDEPPVQPESHVAMHVSWKCFVPLQPVECCGEGAGPQDTGSHANDEPLYCPFASHLNVVDSPV